MARSSSGRKGWVVDNPFFSRSTCRILLSISTWAMRKPQASDTRNPCRNIISSRHRSRAAFRLPLTAAISFSTSAKTRCFRSFIVLSNVHLFDYHATTRYYYHLFLPYFQTLDKIIHFVYRVIVNLRQQFADTYGRQDAEVEVVRCVNVG